MDSCPNCNQSFRTSPAAKMPWPKHDRLLDGAGRVHALGARASAEASAELAYHCDARDCALAIIDKFTGRATPKLLHAAGADRMPPPAVRVVPDDFAGRAEYRRAQACQSDRRADFALQQEDHRAAELLLMRGAKMRKRGGGS